MRKTKIVATLGPASTGEEQVSELLQAGVDVFRLNFSHGTHEEHAATAGVIRKQAMSQGRSVAILQDLQGPRIRTGKLVDSAPVHLEPGSPLVLTTKQIDGTAGMVSVTYDGLPKDAHVGSRILIADGSIELRVVKATSTALQTEVIRGGELGERKGINVPDVHLNVKSFTEKDQEDLHLGVSLGVDYIALSFVRSAADVEEVRSAIWALGASIPIVAKIESQEALECLDEILKASDGVMVARGDLGVELGPERVPMLQKSILQRASELGVPSITATQMLESMITSPSPTRAEASDVANAILDGTDAVMLSGETAVGANPVAAVRTMDSIALEVESHAPRLEGHVQLSSDHSHSLAHAATLVAEEVNATAIAVFTHSGFTAQLLSKQAPMIPIYAFTSREDTYQRLALWHGVTALHGDFEKDTDTMIAGMLGELRDRQFAGLGHNVVVVRLSPPGGKHLSNFITVRVVTL
jgi:pyruvate kinase